MLKEAPRAPQIVEKERPFIAFLVERFVAYFVWGTINEDPSLLTSMKCVGPRSFVLG